MRERGYRPRVTVIDAGYGNNTPFVKQLEARNLTYIALKSKNSQVTYQLLTDSEPRKHGARRNGTDVASRMLDKSATERVNSHVLFGGVTSGAYPKARRKANCCDSTECFDMVRSVPRWITSSPMLQRSQVSTTWVATTYSQRNWVEVFNRDGIAAG